MYATKPLSIFKALPETALQPPPEGLSSGYLVREEEEEPDGGGGSACCWGSLCRRTRVRDLPFPQNRILTVEYSAGSNSTFTAVVFFIPVLDKPLSSNHYYVVDVGKGKDRGKIYTCSKEEDKRTCCFCRCINDVKPSPFDHRNIYQQMEIVPKKGRFTAKSVAPDGFVPWLFRQKYWEVYAKQPEIDGLGDALGLDIALRLRPLKLDFPITVEDTQMSTVGKWCCPFFFVKENLSFKEQMNNAMFYEISLEQFWEQIYAKENSYGNANVVEVNNSVQSKRVTVNGKDAVEETNIDGFVWFKDAVSRRESVGLSLAVWNRMKSEQSRGGWADGGEERMERVEEFGGGLINGWKRFGCYVFVERYTFKRMDGSLAFTFDFVHNRKIMTKWE